MDLQAPTLGNTWKRFRRRRLRPWRTVVYHERQKTSGSRASCRGSSPCHIRIGSAVKWVKSPVTLRGVASGGADSLARFIWIGPRDGADFCRLGAEAAQDDLNVKCACPTRGADWYAYAINPTARYTHLAR